MEEFTSKFDKLISKINKISNIKNIVLFFMLFVVLEAIFYIFLIPKFSEITNGGQIIDMRLFYNYNEIYSVIDDFGQEGISFYGYIQLLDLIFPISYALTFSLLINELSKQLYLTSIISKAVLIPFVAALFDYFENIGIFIMLRKHPGNYNLIATITNVFTIFKFTILGISFIISLILGVIIVVRKLKR